MKRSIYDFCEQAYASTSKSVVFKGTQLTVLVNACNEARQMWLDLAAKADGDAEGKVLHQGFRLTGDACRRNAESYRRVGEIVGEASNSYERRVHDCMERLYLEACAEDRRNAAKRAAKTRKARRGA